MHEQNFVFDGELALIEPVVVFYQKSLPVQHFNKINSLTVLHKIGIPDGEAGKSLSSFLNIIDQLLTLQLSRDVIFVALGGGALGDVIGFVANCYKRGVKWVYLPTTLLAAVDACLGGKTAINHELGKNLIGTFYPATKIIIYPEFLITLSDREYNSAFAEVIKYGLIADPSILKFCEDNFDKLRKRDLASLQYIINKCLLIKTSFVENDLCDQQERRYLNFGHTFAHAIELASGHNITHGEAVGIGILIALNLSVEIFELDFKIILRVSELLKKFLLPLHCQNNIEQILGYLCNDKKNNNNYKYNFVLLSALGMPIMWSCTMQELLSLEHIWKQYIGD